MSHPQKILIPCVEFEGVHVRVFKTRVEIRLMNEVRTVLRVASDLLLIPRGVHDRASFLRIQQPESRLRCLLSRHSLRFNLRGWRSFAFRLGGWRSLRSCCRATGYPRACQTHGERNSACCSPVELTLRFAHCPS